MKLLPNEPPGRITRKARQFEEEIARLYAQGYTLAAICRALAAAGVDVSITTVRREVKRQALSMPAPLAARLASPVVTPPRSTSQPTLPAVPPAAPAAPAAPLLRAGLADPPSGKDLAEAFALSRITNPFFRKKELP